MQNAINAWNAHYQPLLEAKAIRPGNEPQLMIHQGEPPAANSIVLVHGLTDSPFLMRAVGKGFYDMGFNVLMPLMPAHGLKHPEEKMERVRVKEWQDEVSFAVECAHELGQKVSIGGLSNGGALSVHKAITSPSDITGGLFLFSAALDIGDFLEHTLRSNSTILSYVLEAGEEIMEAQKGSLVKEDNPYRYSWIPKNGAAQLAELIGQIEGHYHRQKKPKYSDISQPVFAAHSEADKAASIQEIELLMKNHPGGKGKTEFFRMKKKFSVPHASVVLADNIYSPITGEPQEGKNIFFDDMMKRAAAFTRKHLGG